MATLGACSDNNEGPDPDDGLPVDLGKRELANCYIVQKAGQYRFKADNQFNLGEGLPVPPEIHPVSASLVWQSAPGLISDIELVTTPQGEPYIWFTVEKAEGNALLAALDADGSILWSWHIWMPRQAVESVATATGYEVMNLNLGALDNTPGSVSSYGFLYQWGRKDPFPASPTLTGNTSTVGAPLYDMEGNPVGITNSSWYNTDCNTLEYSVANPTVVLSNYAQYSTSRDWLRTGDNSLWGNPDGEGSGRKTCYDPSPAGWRVAPADAFLNLTTTGGYAWDLDDFAVADSNGDGVISIDDYNYGWHFLVDGDSPLYFPAAARYDGSYAMLMGSVCGVWGSYWSNAPSATVKGGAMSCLSFQVTDMNGGEMITVSPQAAGSKADAYSIRCVRDK